MIEISAGVRELCRYFGVSLSTMKKNVGIQVESSSLSDVQSIEYLEEGKLPERVTDQPPLDIPPAKDDM